MPTYNYSKLKGKIIEVFGSQRAFASALGKGEEYVSRFLNGRFFLEQPELETWMELLDVPFEEVRVYFFTHQVDETQTDSEEDT